MNLFPILLLIIKASGILGAFLMNSRMCTSISLFSCFMEEKCNLCGLSLLAWSMSPVLFRILQYLQSGLLNPRSLVEVH